MRNRRRILILLAVALLAVAGLLLLRGEREPSCKGRRLSQWLELTHDSSIDTRNAAADAIRQIGTNAIPCLLTWIRYEAPAWKTRWYPKLNGLLTRLNKRWLLTDKQEQLADRATEAFQMLGPEAAGAVGDLRRLMNAPQANRSAEQAAYSLINIGEAAIPTLLPALTNKQTALRLAAVYGIRRFASKGGSLGTNGPFAASALIQCLKDTNAGVASMGVYSLGKLQLEPDSVVPALTAVLEDSRPAVRNSAALALAEFQGHGRPEVPILFSLLTNKSVSPSTRSNATNALRKIAPELLTNAPPPTSKAPP